MRWLPSLHVAYLSGKNKEFRFDEVEEDEKAPLQQGGVSDVSTTGSVMCTTCEAQISLRRGCYRRLMGTSAGIRGLVESYTRQMIEEHGAWPKNMLQLGLECRHRPPEGNVEGIYQDETAKILGQMDRAGEIDVFGKEIEGEEHRFVGEVGREGVPDDVMEHYLKITEFLNECGHFASLTAYVALCGVVEELDNVSISVSPEDDYSILYHVSRPPDVLLQYDCEFVPVEVYNGRDTLDTPSERYESDKYEQLRAYQTATSEFDIDCYPMLINRRSTDNLQGTVRQWNGMVIDTDYLLGPENRRREISDTLRFFDISETVAFVEEVEAADGTVITGSMYNEAGADSRLLRPASAIASNESKLPNRYLDRIRGGLQLHYVNSYYRRRYRVNSKEACELIQNVYNQLLREGGKDLGDAIDTAWQEARFGAAMTPVQRDQITDIAREIIDELIAQRIIFRQTGGDIHARRAEHPQQDLSFDI
jgi:hypothetical protein